MTTHSLALHYSRSVGADGFAADHRGQPAALAAAGVLLPLLDADSSGGPSLSADERSLVAAAAAAEVAADPGLRAELLEGLSLFVSGALLAQQPGQAAPAGSEAELEAVLPLLRAKLAQRAEQAGAAAAALLQTRVAQPEADDDGMAAAAAGGAEQQGVLVPVAQLTWGDEPAGGQLPTTLPTELLRYPSCAGMQLQLLALQDARLAGAQLRLLASGGLLRLLLAIGAEAAQQPGTTEGLRALVAAMVGSSGSASVADATSYQLLLWLLEAEAAEGGSGGAAGADWQLALRRSLAHEAWFRWQRGLWTGAATALPAVHASGAPAAAQQLWASAAAGPLRLHIAAGTVLATAVTAAPPALIADRSARLLQLKLAARQLRAAASAASSGAAGPMAAATAEWQAVAALAAATIGAQLPSVADEQQRQQLEAALAWLAGERFSSGALQAAASQHAARDAELLQLAGSALGGSSHAVVRELLQPVLLPALEALLQGSAAAPTASPQGARVHPPACSPAHLSA